MHGDDRHYRQSQGHNPDCGDARRGLANIRTRPLSEEDREQLALNHGRADIGEPDRVAMGYALGKVCEDHGRHAEALAALQSAKRSEEHTSELQSLMRNSYAVLCLK